MHFFGVDRPRELQENLQGVWVIKNQSAFSSLKTGSCEKSNLSSQQNAVAASVEMRALESPDATALVQSGRPVSFAELDRLATGIAANLRSAGVRQNSLVGVYLDSSTEFVASALGVWKAGGAYLPIDPAYPVDRATFILSDSGAAALITRSGLAERVENGPWTTLAIEDLQPENAEEEQDASISHDDLAYVIYTSGSTGEPKGVEITHGNLSNLVEWHNREFAVTSGDRATQIAGPAFDAAVWEIWPYLAAGAAVHFPAHEARLSGAHLRDWLVAERITVSFAPTVLAEEILGLAWPSNTSLRYLLTGGDALHSFPPESLPFQLVNNYGPTECTVVATSATVKAASAGRGAPAIGRAISNTSIYLLDESQQEVSDGETGEIYIGGPSVGRGYRNRPDLTAERFVAIAVAGGVERVFRTGDLARRLPDGQLAFMGRADDQIKLRGFRIEPDEISCVLNRHPLIVSSVVIARSESGEKRLTAYIVPAEGAEIWERDILDLLTRHLPDYMVPANFVLLDRIPVTENGKLDKTALPAPTERNQARRDAYVGPRNDLEEVVQKTIGQILGLERVSIFDNFFLLGGHSLMGAQLIAKVRGIFGVEMVLRNIFECPSVAKLAARIETLLAATLDAMSDEEVDEALRANSAGRLALAQFSIRAD